MTTNIAVNTVLSTDDFQYIAHISDIHIRLSSRFDEYENVLQRFVNCLKEYEQIIVVITGDIFHSKNELTPDCVMFTVNFLRKIAKICPLIVIPGNHDFLLHNMQKIDSITSILHRRSMKNVYYLRESGVYRFGNLLIIHNSLWNPENIPWIHPSSVRTTSEKDRIICLYHGMVGKCKTLSGFSLESLETLSPSHFDGSDMVLLGDIHHHQEIRHNIVYAGSMISQNFNETEDEHGFVLWNLQNRSWSFHILLNDYAFRRIDIHPHLGQFIFLGNIFNDIQSIYEKIGEKMRLEICIYDDDEYDCLSIRKLFHQKHIQPRIRYMHSFQENKTLPLSTNVDTQYIQNKTSMENLLQEYLQKSPNELSKYMKNLDLSFVIKQILENVSIFHHSDHSSNLNRSNTWKLLDLSFDYMFGYGDNNHIIFHSKTPNPKIIGIFGENSVGKSTIIDIILYMLYGRITRYSSGNSVPSELIHEKRNEFSAELRFQVGSSVYTIKKKGKRNKKSKKIKVEESVFRTDDNGVTTNLTEEHRIKTDKIVIDVIGGMEQFMYLSMCTQTPTKSFREMTQKERKEFLFHLFDLDSFESYYTKIYQELKTKETQIHLLESRLKEFSCSSDEEWQNMMTLQSENLEMNRKNVENLDVKKQMLDKEYKTWIELNTRSKELHQRLHISSSKIDNLRISIDSIHLTPLQNENNNEDIELIRNTLDSHRNKMKELRNKFQKIRYGRRPTVKFPIMNGFSFTRWRGLKRFSETHKDGGGKRRYKRLEYYDSRNLENEFSFFEFDKNLEMLNQMNEIEKNEIPFIYERFDKIRKYGDEVDKKRIIWDRLNEEFNINRHVEYNDECEKCLVNPFRKRQMDLEERCRKTKEEVEKMEKKIKNEKRKLGNEIIRLFKSVQSNGLLDISFDWTKAKFLEEWDLLKMKIQNRQSQINLFRTHLENLCKNFYHRYEESEYRKFEEYKLFFEKMDEFMLTNIRNRISESEENRLIVEMERLEEECTDMENKMTDYSNRLRRNQMEWEWKDMVKKRDEDMKDLDRVNKLLGEMGDVEKKMNQVQEMFMEVTKEVVHDEHEFKMMKSEYEEWRIVFSKYCKMRDESVLVKALSYICHRQGFPSYLLTTIVGTFNGYMNSILNHFIDRRVRFDICSENGDVVFEVQSNDSTIGMHFYGGMESLMIDLATKITFAHFGMCPMTSFFVLDENISVLDEQHLQNIHILFSFLKQHYQHVLLVTHISTVKNMVDDEIHISKTDGYSRITFDM